MMKVQKSSEAEKELKTMEDRYYLSLNKLDAANETYKNFALQSSVGYRIFRLFLMGFMLSSVLGALIMIIFSKSKLALFFELVISFATLFLIVALVVYSGGRWGVLGGIFCIPIAIFFCIKIISWIKSYLARSVSSSERNLADAKLKFDGVMSSILVPQIHLLMMATLNDVMLKTSARLLRKESILELLEKQVGSGSMTKVPLIGEAEVLYKSSTNTNIEQLIIEVD